jgi:hypothetical protein
MTGRFGRSPSDVVAPRGAAASAFLPSSLGVLAIAGQRAMARRSRTTHRQLVLALVGWRPLILPMPLPIATPSTAALFANGAHRRIAHSALKARDVWLSHAGGGAEVVAGALRRRCASTALTLTPSCVAAL